MTVQIVTEGLKQAKICKNELKKSGKKWLRQLGSTVSKARCARASRMSGIGNVVITLANYQCFSQNLGQ